MRMITGPHCDIVTRVTAPTAHESRPPGIAGLFSAMLDDLMMGDLAAVAGSVNERGPKTVCRYPWYQNRKSGARNHQKINSLSIRI